MEGRKGVSAMTERLQHWFALSEKGAKDLIKAVIWCFICNIGLMLPVGVVMFAIMHLLEVMADHTTAMSQFWTITGSGLLSWCCSLCCIGFSMLRFIWRPTRKAPTAE